MKNIFKPIVFVILSFWYFGAYSQNDQKIKRSILFDKDWHFHLGDDAMAKLPQYDDSKWRVLDLPHDWSIEPLQNQLKDSVVGPFSRKSIGGPDVGQTLGGIAWYRKSFTVKPGNENKLYTIYFEGVYNQSEVWVNGQKVGFNTYGYSSFQFDISKYLNPVGQKNIIAVKVMNEGHNSRWYTGSGIYRHVRLIETEKVYFDTWQTAILTSKVTKESANIQISTTILNASNASNATKKLKVTVKILSPKGIEIASETNHTEVGVTEFSQPKFDILLKNPQLWSLENPNLYIVNFSMWDGSKQLDEISIPVGIRDLEFSATKGFLLNGNAVKLKGGCIHHDNGILGAVAYDRAEERKIELLKKNRYNAIRLSHNPPSEYFLEVCDRLGMLVIYEAFDQWKQKKRPDDYHKSFDESSAKDIKTMVLRDRNHPSIIMWSIGNEIPERANDKGLVISEYLRNEFLKFDTSRPITAGVNKLWDAKHENMLPLDKAFKNLDVDGYNYMWRFYEEEHAKNPHKVLFGSESVASEAAQNWAKVEKYPYVIGDFVWTAIDYLGESGLGSSLEVLPEENVPQFMGWPWYNAWCGDLDLIGIKKPQSYYRDVVWRLREIAMAVQPPVEDNKIRKVSFWGWINETLSWTFPGLENKVMTVNVYSRAPKVRLYLNNKLIGEAVTTLDTYKAVFTVPYQKGILKAVALNGDQETSSVILETTSEAVAIRLSTDRKKIQANGQDLAYITVELIDEKGNVVVDNNRSITIKSKGKGQIIASGNAAPTDMESFRSLKPKLFNGRALIILKSGEKAGIIKLDVFSKGLKSASTKVLAF
jgi:beta-galactosidase